VKIKHHQRNKEFFAQFRQTLYNLNPDTLQNYLSEIFTPESTIYLPFPFNTLQSGEALFDQAYAPLLHAMPDLERRDFLVMAGEANGDFWIGCAGYYMGVFEQAWLGIPPTHHIAGMRYHEFFKIVDQQIVEMQALWDIPELMMQANAWAMTPSLGVQWIAPSPAPQDGLQSDKPPNRETSLKIVYDMVDALKLSVDGHEAMNLERFWHPKMNWYGPAGIGTARQLEGFRRWHQIPFLNAMPDRIAILENGAFFADGDYVGFTAFPGMKMTLSGDGWLGIAPTNRAIDMRSLDFWRCEDGLIRENWVLVDLLHVYDQIGVDVFARMREYTYARQPK